MYLNHMHLNDIDINEKAQNSKTEERYAFVLWLTHSEVGVGPRGAESDRAV